MGDLGLDRSLPQPIMQVQALKTPEQHRVVSDDAPIRRGQLFPIATLVFPFIHSSTVKNLGKK
jgi:hypothetical protein